MSYVEGFELANLVLESDILEEVAHDVMNSPEVLKTAESFDVLKKTISEQVTYWQHQVKQKLLNQPVNQDLQQETAFYYEVIDYDDEYFLEHIESIVKRLDINSPFIEKAHDLLTKQNQKYNPLFKHLFCEQWYHSLFNELQDKQQQYVNSEKQKLLDDLYQRHETISQLHDIDESNNQQVTMRLWDMARSKLSKIDVNCLKNIVNFLHKHSELQKIAEELGRSASQNDDPESNPIKVEKELPDAPKTDNHSGELSGLHQSDDLENILPNELMFLAYPDLEVIFYKHLAEKRLATYQQQSTIRQNNKVTTIEHKNKQADQDKGPFIIAIDASGSMMGLAEQSAKAFAYGLMQIALAEGRQCYVIIFSTQQITYELTKENGLSEMLSFLSYSFHGGTDITSVLEKSFTLMKTEHYKNADLIILSDFMAPSLNAKTVNEIKAMKTANNRFHALSLSKYKNQTLIDLFDQHWEYNPSRIVGFKRLFS